MNKSLLHKYLQWGAVILSSPLFITHIILYLSCRKAKHLIDSDIERWKHNCGTTNNKILLCLYFLQNDGAFRKLFYHRLGVPGYLISWIRPGLKSLSISRSMPIGEGCYLPHPNSTILSAKSIGKNFTCMQLTTLGKEKGENPIIGDNVFLGANVTIIGGITIGNNVTVGAGSVVVKDIPDNCVVGGVPAKIIKFKHNIENT